MHRSSIFLAVFSAALAAAQGFSTECSDISLTDYWLVATCPTSNSDSITSSVFLNAKLANSNGNLEWAENGHYVQSCRDCTLDGATLSCECKIASLPRYQSTTLDLEEHIANYGGHLLSNQTGAITTIPSDSSVAVPSDFDVTLALATTGTACESTGVTLGLNNPTDCYYANLGVTIEYTAALQTNNQGWEIVAYADTECTSDPVYTFAPDDDDTCVLFNETVQAFSVKPSWNADY
ncbi:Cyanovirin-N [Aspergillus recurvatus]